MTDSTPVQTAVMREGRLGRDFWFLWVGQGLSMVGSEIVVVAAPFVAIAALHASAIQIGLLSTVQTLAFLVVTLPAGLFVDRVGARRIMWWANLARALIAGSIATLIMADELNFLSFLLLVAIAGCFAVLFDVAYPTLLPRIVEKDLLGRANSRLSGTQSVAQVVGPPVGGVLVGAVGSAFAFMADGLSFVVSLVTMSLMRGGRNSDQSPPAVSSDSGWLRNLHVGIRFVWRQRVLRAGMLWSGSANIFVVMVETIGVLYLLRELKLSAEVVGVLLAFGAVGGVLGAVAVGRVNRVLGSSRATWMAMTVFALPGLLMPMAESGPRVILFGLGWVSWTMSATIASINLLTYRQKVAPEGTLGQVNAAVRWVTWGTLPVGGIVGGVLGSAIGVHTTLWVGVIGGCCSGLWLFFSPLRTARDLTL